MINIYLAIKAYILSLVFSYTQLTENNLTYFALKH